MKTTEGGRPVVGDQFLRLGVRDNELHGGGPSVCPSWETISVFLLPTRLNGRGPFQGCLRDDVEISIFRLGEVPFAAGSVANGLDLRPGTPDADGIIKKGEIVLAAGQQVTHFRQLVINTEPTWEIDEP